MLENRSGDFKDLPGPSSDALPVNLSASWRIGISSGQKGFWNRVPGLGRWEGWNLFHRSGSNRRRRGATSSGIWHLPDTVGNRVPVWYVELSLLTSPGKKPSDIAALRMSTLG